MMCAQAAQLVEPCTSFIANHPRETASGNRVLRLSSGWVV
jgi:hypothetical protein